MTDKEIIKALECCGCSANVCNDCPITTALKDDCKCGEYLATNALDLINRQKAEVERLTAERDAMHQDVIAAEEYAWQCKTAKAEAYKEFAERLKDMHKHNTTSVVSLVTVFDNINNLVKEMVGDNNA